MKEMRKRDSGWLISKEDFLQMFVEETEQRVKAFGKLLINVKA